MNAQSEIRNCLLVLISFVCELFFLSLSPRMIHIKFFAFTFPIRTILLCHIDYIVIEIEIENETRCTLFVFAGCCCFLVVDSCCCCCCCMIDFNQAFVVFSFDFCVMAQLQCHLNITERMIR